jgi:BirA family biotin operon repressor/biotin-[acetyl-CoA-carboxylase] ligase
MQFALGPKAIAAGYRLDARETIGSTNAEALARARAGEAGRFWVATANQSAGRGRRGRPWATPPGNLAATVLTIVKADTMLGATLGFVAGLALDESLRRVAPGLALATALDAVEAGHGQQDRLRLKWPNDVLLDGKKLAGILLEAEPLAGGRLAVAAGIGVNVVSAPEGLPFPATALAALGIPVDAPGVFEALSDAWAGLERIWDGGRGFATIRDLWLDRAAGVGEAVAVKAGGEVRTGVFETIDRDGRLVIRADDGSRRLISAGEVHFGTVATVHS